MSDKTIKTLIIAGVLVVGAWFAWRYYQNYKAQQAGGVPQLGTNLASVAPELVGGSSGPTVQPAVNTPINITITDNTQRGQMPEEPNVPMLPQSPTNNPLESANVAPADMMPADASTEPPAMKTGSY